MPKTIKERVQEKYIQIKGEGVYKGSNPPGARKEQSPESEKLPFTQFVTKTVELFELMKDKRNVHQIIKNMLRASKFVYNNCKEEPKPAIPKVSHLSDT